MDRVQEYVIGIAEQFGVDYFNAPLHAKPKSVQIIEFLHHGAEGQESYVWARISDSSRYMTARFSSEAAKEFKLVLGKRLTEYRTGIIRIKDFKPFFGRIPIGGKQMTKKDTLVLECRSANPRGSFGEKRVGNPLDVTMHPDIKLWIEGINRGGGEGNVLKQRRIEREQNEPEKQVDDKAMVQHLEQQKLGVVARKSTARISRASTAKTALVNEPKAKYKPWKPRIPALFGIPPEIIAALRALPIEGEETESLPPKRQDSVNDDESPRKRRRIDDDANEKLDDMDIDDEDDDGRSSQPLSGWSASEHEDDNEDDEQSIQGEQPPDSPQVPANLPTGSQQMNSVPMQEHSPLPASHKSPPSSLPPISSYAKMEAPLSSSMPAPKYSPSQDPRLRVMRRVPPPKQPQELTQASGQKERVLAPASDTSMSQSQSQSQSQRRRDVNKPGSSPMRGPAEEDMRLLVQVKETVKRDVPLQVARKSSLQSPSKQDIMINDQQQHKEQSHGKLNPEAKNIDRMSDDDRETNQQFFGDSRKVEERESSAKMEKLRSDNWELPPSKMGDNNSTRAKPNGLQPVSTSNTALSKMATPVQHDPGTWSKPSFMKPQKTAVRQGPKLGGFAAQLTGMKKSEAGTLAWLSWKELGRILEES